MTKHRTTWVCLVIALCGYLYLVYKLITCIFLSNYYTARKYSRKLQSGKEVNNEERQNELETEWWLSQGVPSPRNWADQSFRFWSQACSFFYCFFFPGLPGHWELPLSPRFPFTSSLLPSHSFFLQVLLKPLSKLKLQMSFLHSEWQWGALFEQLNAPMADIWLSSLKPKAYETIHHLNRTNYCCCSQPSLPLEGSFVFWVFF